MTTPTMQVSRIILSRGVQPLFGIRPTTTAAVRSSGLIRSNVLPSHRSTARLTTGVATTTTTTPVRSLSSTPRQCPFSSSSVDVQQQPQQQQSVEATRTTTNKNTSSTTTKLTIVPALPIVGSFIPAHSGVPVELLDGDSTNRDFYPEMRKRFGDFYSFGMPTVGRGSEGEMYVVTDPKEMMKVIRQESASSSSTSTKNTTDRYPMGAIQAEWPNLTMLKGKKSVLVGNGDDDDDGDNGLFGNGENWKRLRTFLQTDLLSPQAAKGYIPGMVEAAKIASRAAPQWSQKEEGEETHGNMMTFCQRSAFDMFSSLMFGELSKTADPSTATEENMKFCNYASTEFRAMADQMLSPMERILSEVVGYKTPKFQEMSDAHGAAFAIGQSKFERFKERMASNELSEQEQKSYLALAIERQRQGEQVTEEELMHLAIFILHAGVDTTSSSLGWQMSQLAANPNVQERLFEEISAAVREEGGDTINENVLKRSTSPYLHAFLREVHRVTPSLPMSVLKSNGVSDLEIHGTTVPKDSIILLDTYSIGIDPEFVEDLFEFRPERWLAENVQARKGTSSEIIDHPFAKDPFSQGSRKCPGSRVANNELMILTCQLVLDWKIKAPEGYQNWRDMKYDFHGLYYPRIPNLIFESRRHA